MILRAAALLGLPPGVPDPTFHVALCRDLLVVLALAAAAREACGRRGAAFVLAVVFAVLGVGFWVAALGRAYGVLADPGVTRWAADVAVAGWAGGVESAVVGESSPAGVWPALARRVRPDLILLAPTVLPLVVLPATALLIVGLRPRPRSYLAAILWLGAGTGTLESLRGLGLLPGLWARPGPSLFWMATVAVLLAASRVRRAAVVVAASVLAVGAWLALGPRGPAIGAADAVLTLFFDPHVLLIAGAFGLLRGRDRAAGALVAVGAVLVLARGLAGAGDAWAGIALYRLGLILAAAGWLDDVAATLVPSDRVRAWAARVGAVPSRLPVALVVAVTLSGGMLAWWDPPRTDPVAKASLEPIPSALVEAMAWMRAHTDPQAAVLAPDDYAPAVAVLGGRRLLRASALATPADDERRLRLERAVFAGQAPEALRQRYGLRYVFLAPGEFREHGIEEPEDLERRGGVHLVYANAKGMRLYELARPGAREPIK